MRTYNKRTSEILCEKYTIEGKQTNHNLEPLILQKNILGHDFFKHMQEF